MDEPWVCPKCGFTNEYYAAYCVSCSEVRPSEGGTSAGSADQAGGLGPSADKSLRDFQAEAKALAASAPMPASAPRSMSAPAPRPTAGAVKPGTTAPAPRGTAAPAPTPTSTATSAGTSAPTSDGAGDPCHICGRRPAALFSFDSNRGMILKREVFRFHGRLCRTCAKGVYREHQTRNLGWGWLGSVSLLSAIAWSISNLRDYRKNLKGLGAPLPTDAATERRLAGRPIIKGLLPGLGILVAIVAAVVIGFTVQGRGEIDQSYIDEFYTINAVRNEVIDLSNSRYDLWQAVSQYTVPGAQYLVVDELAYFETQVERMSLPKSDGLRAMHQAWMTTVQNLAAAERLLAQENTQANLDADMQAWFAEETAYEGMFDYCKKHDRPE